MGNNNSIIDWVLFDDYTLKYDIQNEDKTYESTVIYDPASSTDKDYFTPSDNHITKKIRFNDVEDHDVLINKIGTPMITTYGSDYVQAIKARKDKKRFNANPQDNPQYINYGFISDDETKYNKNVTIKSVIAVIIIAIVSVLLAILLDDYNWYFLLILLLVPIIYFIGSQTSKNKSWYHVYLYLKT